MRNDSSLADLIEIMCFSTEYSIFPVRHNEDKTNQELTSVLEYRTSIPMDSPHLKVILLIYAYLSDLEPPTREYMVDTKSVLDQALRILQGMLDIVTNNSWLSVSLKIILLLQMILQGFWITQSCLAMLPHVKKEDIPSLHNNLCNYIGNSHQYFTLANLKCKYTEMSGKFREIFASVVGATESRDIERFLSNLPFILISLTTVEESTETQQNIDLTNGKMYQFKADSIIEFKFQLNRIGSSSLEVHSNKFTKQKEESWVLIVGLPEEDLLLTSKKLSFKKQKTVNMKLKIPSKKG